MRTMPRCVTTRWSLSSTTGARNSTRSSPPRRPPAGRADYRHDGQVGRPAYRHLVPPAVGRRGLEGRTERHRGAGRRFHGYRQPQQGHARGVRFALCADEIRRGAVHFRRGDAARMDRGRCRDLLPQRHPRFGQILGRGCRVADHSRRGDREFPGERALRRDARNDHRPEIRGLVLGRLRGVGRVPAHRVIPRSRSAAARSTTTSCPPGWSIRPTPWKPTRTTTMRPWSG